MGQDCPSVLLYMMHSNNNNSIYIYTKHQDQLFACHTCIVVSMSGLGGMRGRTSAEINWIHYS